MYSAFVAAAQPVRHLRHGRRACARAPTVRACMRTPRKRTASRATPDEQTALLPTDNGAFIDDDEPPQAPGLAERASALDVRVLLGEFVSTFMFIYISVSAAGAPVGTTPAALTNGAAVAAIAASFMPVSGAHLNPAVTAALLATRRISPLRAAVFIPVQLAAAALASTAVRALGVPVIAATPAGDMMFRAFVNEAAPMAIIVFIVFQTAVATPKEGGVGGPLAALYIGLSVLACVASFGTGVFNPARAFGPAFVTGQFQGHWVYWVGPVVGALFAALVAEHLFIAPAVGRQPNSWLQVGWDKLGKTRERVRVLGSAGLIAYGILNLIFYPVVMGLVLVKSGSFTAVSLGKAWLIAWGLSNATKPIRLLVTIAVAPFIQRWLLKWKAGRKQDS